MGLREAVKAMQQGVPVLIHDDSSREDEVDYVIRADAVDAERVYEMRVLAGGLICYAMPLWAARLLGLRYFYELAEGVPELAPLVSKTPGYGDKPAFSVWVNHVAVRTGIRDEDRALTIRSLDRVTKMVYEGRAGEAAEVFRSEFMAPGHVPVLLGRSLDERRGHTELSLHLAALAGVTPSVVLVEMLDRGGALSLRDAQRISEERGYPLVSGSEIIEAYEAERERLCSSYRLCSASSSSSLPSSASL